MFYSWEKQGPNLKQYLAVINRAGGLFERILTGDTLYTERDEAFYQLLFFFFFFTSYLQETIRLRIE